MDDKLSQRITDSGKELSQRIAEWTIGCHSVLPIRTRSLSQRINDTAVLIRLQIENDVTRRIELLFDGYQLANEKQLETDQRVDDLEERVEKLEIKAG